MVGFVGSWSLLILLYQDKTSQSKTQAKLDERRIWAQKNLTGKGYLSGSINPYLIKLPQINRLVIF